MARKSPQAFINQFNGAIDDFDGVYGTQCVDGFKRCCYWLGVPVRATQTGYADGYWVYRNEYAKYATFITDVNKLRSGDWCVWNWGSSCPSTHIAMFVSYAEAGYAWFFGENQGGNRGFRTIKLKLDIMGAIRFNAWEYEPAEAPTGEVKASGVAHCFDRKFAKTYYATDALNCRNSGSTEARILVTVPKGTAVTCYGYYDVRSGYTWLYAQAMVKGTLYTGFFASAYLSTSKGSSVPVPKAVTVGSRIKIRKGAMQYGKNVGFASKVYNTVYTVSEINGDRVVFNAGNVVMGAVSKANCIVQ